MAALERRDRALAGVEAEPSLARIGVGAVARQALGGKERAHRAIEVDALGGRLNGCPGVRNPDGAIGAHSGHQRRHSRHRAKRGDARHRHRVQRPTSHAESIAAVRFRRKPALKGWREFPGVRRPRFRPMARRRP